jgi:hypothetical protein
MWKWIIQLALLKVIRSKLQEMLCNFHTSINQPINQKFPRFPLTFHLSGLNPLFMVAGRVVEIYVEVLAFKEGRHSYSVGSKYQRIWCEYLLGLKRI